MTQQRTCRFCYAQLSPCHLINLLADPQFHLDRHVPSAVVSWPAETPLLLLPLILNVHVPYQHNTSMAVTNSQYQSDSTTSTLACMATAVTGIHLWLWLTVATPLPFKWVCAMPVVETGVKQGSLGLPCVLKFGGVWCWCQADEGCWDDVSGEEGVWWCGHLKWKLRN